MRTAVNHLCWALHTVADSSYAHFLKLDRDITRLTERRRAASFNKKTPFRRPS